MFKEYGELYMLKSNAKNPLPTYYNTQIDVMEEFGGKLGFRSLQLIGILRRGVKLGWKYIFLINIFSIRPTLLGSPGVIVSHFIIVRCNLIQKI